MSDSAKIISEIRKSTCAIMRIRPLNNSGKKGQFNVGFVGTGFCVVENEIVMTAQHVLNGGQPSDPKDKFVLFTVPDNGAQAYHFPVTKILKEDSSLDFCLLKFGANPDKNRKIESISLSDLDIEDGELVSSHGFPSPVVKGANLDNKGNFVGGGQFFLKAHSNSGILAAQYLEGTTTKMAEFTIGWHHGESGGPVVSNEKCAVIAMMQHYRNIQGPHGIVMGPRRGRAIENWKTELQNVGAKFI